MDAIPKPRRRLAALAAAVVAIAAGASGYVLGDSAGNDLQEAREAGARSGEIEGSDRGSQKGYDEGFEAGFREGKARGTRDTYYKALAKAGVKPAQLTTGGFVD